MLRHIGSPVSLIQVRGKRCLNTQLPDNGEVSVAAYLRPMRVGGKTPGSIHFLRSYRILTTHRLSARRLKSYSSHSKSLNID